MKRKLIFYFALFAATALSAQERLPYWRDMNVISINKQAPRTSFMTYDNETAALTGEYEKSRFYKLLNGTWKFYFTDDQRKLPAGTEDPGSDVSSWSDIKVPTSWEVQGFGDAVYVNHPYDFQPRNPQPPLLPDETAVGVYRREFDVPADWDGRDIYLHVAGAKSGMYVYINGQEVGYSEDAKDPAEFLINQYLKPGQNTLVLKIYRWSTGSYLECQDFFRLSGIFRDVFLWSQPKVAVNDFRVLSTLDDAYRNGVFALGIDVKNTGAQPSQATVGYKLLDAGGAVVRSGNQKIDMSANSTQALVFEASIPGVQQWNSEHPYLYKLLVSIEKDGKVTEIVPYNVGFRRIEIKESDYTVNGKKQNLFYVNGQPIKLKGVNIHETNAHGGHYVTPEQMRENFRLMKLHNVNSVRLSHYPQDRRFYEMCDKYGLYVYDEANIESHGMYYNLRKGGTLGNNPDWERHHMERIANFYERNKNYPSVTIWSLGNEAGNGYNFYQAYLYIKSREDRLMGRPICYERAQWEWNSDMYVPQYPSAAWLEDVGRTGSDRPVVPSEYSHAMGNSNGDLYGQWQAIYKYPHLQGGYIWEWIDHTILTKNEDGKVFFAYGGDFGKDLPSDGNFVADGVISGDQTPHPAMAEVKYTHQNIAFEAVDLSGGTLVVDVLNRFYFNDLSQYKLSYTITRNGEKVASGVIKANPGPQEAEKISIAAPTLTADGAEYFLNLSVSTTIDDELVPAGTVVANEQLKLPVRGNRQAYTAQRGPKLTVEQDASAVTVRSSKVVFRFDKAKGVVSSYKVDGTEYFNEGFGLQPNFWRGPTDNDYGNGMPRRLQVWKQSSSDFNVESINTVEKEGNVLLTVDYKLAAGNNYTVNYEIFTSGVVKASIRFTPVTGLKALDEKTQAELAATASPKTQAELKARNDILEVPRIGVRFRLPASMDKITYFGRGPEENYVDRYMGTMVGLYTARAWDLYFPYARPQENGHHTDTRWVAATNSGDKGLLVVGGDPIGFNALRNSVEDFDAQESDAPYQWGNFSAAEVANRNYENAKERLIKQTHAIDIAPRDFVEVCIDMRQQGIAGYNSWGDRGIPEARIFSDVQYDWSFTLVPVGGRKDMMKKAVLEY